MYRLNYCQPGALPPFRAFALTAREGLVALPRVSLPSVAGPGLQALPPAEVEGWPSAILNAAYGAYTMETICGTTHCDCLPDSNNSLYTILNYVLILLTHRFRLPDMQETGPSVRQRPEAPRWDAVSRHFPHKPPTIVLPFPIFVIPLPYTHHLILTL